MTWTTTGISIWQSPSKSCASGSGSGFALNNAGNFDVARVNDGRLAQDHVHVVTNAFAIVAPKDRGITPCAARRRISKERCRPRPQAILWRRVFHTNTCFGPRLKHPLFNFAGVAPDPGAVADAWGRITRFFDEELASNVKVVCSDCPTLIVAR